MSNWKAWLKGLVAAVVSGVSNAVLVYVVDPVHFSEWDKLGKILLGSSLIAASVYLKSKPVPEDTSVVLTGDPKIVNITTTPTPVVEKTDLIVKP